MKRFKNILVGIDLSENDVFVSRQLTPPTQEAVNRAFWLAKLNGAKLTFLYSLDVSARTQHLIESDRDSGSSLLDKSEKMLSSLVEKAKKQGIAAESKVEFGKSWLVLIQQVLRNKHDLLLAGTRDKGEMQTMLFGSTGIKLMRKCPCPVWITKPQDDRPIESILVAHDLGDVGKFAMQLGASRASLQGSQLHVVHSLTDPGNDIADGSADEYRAQAEKEIAEQLTNFDLKVPAQVHLVSELPHEAVARLIETEKIELLVMGTIARTGLPGVIVGNTAERLLHQIPCSVLAVKPADFQSPITLD